MARPTYTRVREIIDATGLRLRVTITQGMTAATVALERPDLPQGEPILLSVRGADILCGFVLASRLAAPGDLAEERALGADAAIFRLVHRPSHHIQVVQSGCAQPLTIPASFWDRLFAELLIVGAHGRSMADSQAQPVSVLLQ